LPSEASINDLGCVLLGKHVACDGVCSNRTVGVFTHAHDDHIGRLEKGLLWYSRILATPATKDLAIARKGDWLGLRGHLTKLDFKKRLEIDAESVTLYPTRHMLGSAQVLVENREGRRALYTGDFMFPQTPVIETDLLVLDATYGHPSNVRRYSREEAIKALTKLVDNKLKGGPVWISAHFGKLQEVMNALCEAGVKVPFLITDFENLRAVKVYEKYGVKMGEYIFGPEGHEILSRKESCVVFTKLSYAPPEAKEFVRIRVSGWAEFNGALFQRDEKYYRVALSDHADFSETIEYVKQSKPKFVITDDYRGSGAALAEAIKKDLRIEAIKMP